MKKKSEQINNSMRKSKFCHLLAIALLSILFISFVSAGDPGHSAPSIGAGTFEAGNYVFPNTKNSEALNLSNSLSREFETEKQILCNLSVGASGFFANGQTGNVGIGTTEVLNG